MKRINMLLAGMMLSAGLIFTSCSDDESLNTGRVKLAVSTTSSSTFNGNARIAVANDLSFTKGTITIREVVFDGENDSQSVSRTIEQVADIDYSTGAVSPEVIVEVPVGDYTSVNLGIELQDENSDPSVVIEGTYINSEGMNIPVRFEFNSGEVFEANAERVSIEAGADIVGKITFDALDWFSVITPDQLDNAALTDGVMVISDTQNTSIFSAVADRLDVATQAVFQ